MFWQVLTNKGENMEWADKVLSVLYLLVIVAGSVVAIILIEERNKRK